MKTLTPDWTRLLFSLRFLGNALRSAASAPDLESHHDIEIDISWWAHNNLFLTTLSATLRHGIVASVVKYHRPNTLLVGQKRLCSKNAIDTREAGSCLKDSCSFYTSRLAGEKGLPRCAATPGCWPSKPFALLWRLAVCSSQSSSWSPSANEFLLHQATNFYTRIGELYALSVA